MQEITNVRQLEIGKWYWLFSKSKSKTFIGLEQLQWDGHTKMTNVHDEETGEVLAEVPAAHFNGRWWAHVGNDSAVSNYHIFGPFDPPKFPTYEEAVLLCEKKVS